MCKFFLRKLFPRMDIQLSSEIAIRLYHIINRIGGERVLDLTSKCMSTSERASVRASDKVKQRANDKKNQRLSDQVSE